MGAQWKAKHKEAAANAKGRIFGKLSKKSDRGPQRCRPGHEPTPAPGGRAGQEGFYAQDTLERAIKKGAGLTGEVVNYERTHPLRRLRPHQVPLIVECLTDNVNRTVCRDPRAVSQGQLGSSGSVSWDFDHVGMIEAAPAGDADPEMAAIEAGAQDFEAADDGATLFITEPTDLDAVCKALPEFGFTVQSAQLGYRPKNPVSLSGAELEEVEAFLRGHRRP